MKKKRKIDYSVQYLTTVVDIKATVVGHVAICGAAGCRGNEACVSLGNHGAGCR